LKKKYSLIYLISVLFDALITITSIDGWREEGNLRVRYLMKHFGATHGLLIYVVIEVTTYFTIAYITQCYLFLLPCSMMHIIAGLTWILKEELYYNITKITTLLLKLIASGIVSINVTKEAWLRWKRKR